MKVLKFILIISFLCLIYGFAQANSIDIISEHIVNDLAKKFQAGEKKSPGERYVSIMPLEVEGSDYTRTIAKKLCGSLAESFFHNTLFTMINIGEGQVYHNQKEKDNVYSSDLFLSLFRKKHNRYLYITGSLKQVKEIYIASIDLVDAATGKKVASKKVSIFSDDVKHLTKKESVESTGNNDLGLIFSDSYMESPLNIPAKLNDIYISYYFTRSLNINLGITNLYLQQNADMALLADEIYPHLFSSPLEGYNSFNPFIYTQFTQVIINKCMPYIGINYCAVVNEFFSINLSVNATFFIMQIPVGQDVVRNPYADLFNNSNDVALVLSGNMQNNYMNIDYPQLMFRLSANPTFHLASNLSLGIHMSFYYTPMPIDVEKYADLPANRHGSISNTSQAFGIERAMILGMNDFNLIGVSVNLSLKRYF